MSKSLISKEIWFLKQKVKAVAFVGHPGICRHRVASGVYLVLITSQDAFETKVLKIMIVR